MLVRSHRCNLLSFSEGVGVLFGGDDLQSSGWWERRQPYYPTQDVMRGQDALIAAPSSIPSMHPFLLLIVRLIVRSAHRWVCLPGRVRDVDAAGVLRSRVAAPGHRARTHSLASRRRAAGLGATRCHMKAWLECNRYFGSSVFPYFLVVWQ
jgi:hypothetical protein